MVRGGRNLLIKSDVEAIRVTMRIYREPYNKLWLSECGGARGAGCRFVVRAVDRRCRQVRIKVEIGRHMWPRLSFMIYEQRTACDKGWGLGKGEVEETRRRD